MHHNWAKACEPSWTSSVELHSMIPRSPRSKRTVAEQLARSDATRKRGLRQGTVTTPDGPAVYMVQTRQAFERHAVLPNPSIEGDVKGWRPWPPSCQTLNIMREAVIAEVDSTIRGGCVVERHLEPTLLAVHLYGSAVDGGPEATQ